MPDADEGTATPDSVDQPPATVSHSGPSVPPSASKPSAKPGSSGALRQPSDGPGVQKPSPFVQSWSIMRNAAPSALWSSPAIAPVIDDPAIDEVRRHGDRVVARTLDVGVTVQSGRDLPAPLRFFQAPVASFSA